MSVIEEWDTEGTTPPEEATSVLLLVPSTSGDHDAACSDLLTRHPPAETDVLFVTFRGPDEPLSTWRAEVGTPPASLAVVVAGGASRGVASGDRTGDGVRVRTVATPSDLTGLGIAIQGTLREWHGDGNHVAVCFRSLTTLLQFAETRRAFRFFHVLLAQLRSTDAHVHVHLDPMAVDDRTVATFHSLFDTVLSPD